MRCFVRALGVVAALLLSAPAHADSPLLTVTGNLAGDAPVTFDREALTALGVVEISTHTPWTDGARRFSGVLVRDVLDAAGARGDSVRAVALNDFAYEIPVSDFADYPVILAFAIDGERLTPRDKGPLWIVYPRDDHPELDTRETDHRMVWQTYRLEVQ